jgi:hypothetical protein
VIITVSPTSSDDHRVDLPAAVCASGEAALGFVVRSSCGFEEALSLGFEENMRPNNFMSHEKIDTKGTEKSTSQ